MAKKVGALIKEARTAAGMTQEQLAKKIKGVSAADISKAERGELDFPQSVLKEIAKATGVTQSSLVNAAKAESGNSSSKKTSSSKTSTAKTSSKTSSKISSSKTSSAKTSSSKTSSSKSSSTGSSMKVTAAEKKIVEAYRGAGSDAKKIALKILKGENLELAEVLKLVNVDAFGGGDFLGGIKESLGGLLGKK